MKSKLFLGLFSIFLAPVLVQAHLLPGDIAGFHHGWKHPLSGWDHLLAMLAVGLWAAQQKSRSQWTAPLAFGVGMIFGGALGMTATTWPGSEMPITLSVLMLGGLLTCSTQLTSQWSVLLMGFFALFHGYAHGREMPATAAATGYGLGFLGTTVLLLGLGMGLGWFLQKNSRQHWLRLGGAGMMLLATSSLLARL